MMRTMVHRSIGLLGVAYYLLLALLGISSYSLRTSRLMEALIIPMLFSIAVLTLVLLLTSALSMLFNVRYLTWEFDPREGLFLGILTFMAAAALFRQLDPVDRSSLLNSPWRLLIAVSFVETVLRSLSSPTPRRPTDKGEEWIQIREWFSRLRGGHDVGVLVFILLFYAVEFRPKEPYGHQSPASWILVFGLTLAAFAYPALKVLKLLVGRDDVLPLAGLMIIPSAAFCQIVLSAPLLDETRTTVLILSLAYTATACHRLAGWARTTTPRWAAETRTAPDAESGDSGGSGTSPLVANRSILHMARRGLIMVILLALVLIVLGGWLLVSFRNLQCVIGVGEGCPLKAGQLRSENELRKAEARLGEIYRLEEMEACTEFKGKRYIEGTKAGNETTELYWTCVHTLSNLLLDERRCLSLSDDYSKRICLEALAEAFQDPSYCQRARWFAQDEAARRDHLPSDICNQTDVGCEHIEEARIREECLLRRAVRARDLDPSLCRTFTHPRVKDECFEIVAALRNLPELCLQTSDADDCYWGAVLVWAFPLGTEDEIDRRSWCQRIATSALRQSCLLEIGR